MSELIQIGNEHLQITVSTHGAELQSVKKDGKELLWQGDPAVWSGRAPILFPICGGLKEDTYLYREKKYHLEKHGFARNSEFIKESAEGCRASFLLASTAETKEKYPFDFLLRVIYLVEKTQLIVSYEVENRTGDEMYFSIGSHEAYACPEGIEAYSILFDREETLRSNFVEGTVLGRERILIAENTKELPLKYEYFADDALVFLDLKSRGAALCKRTTGEKIHVSYPGADYLLLWTIPDARYICIEPWSGCPDFSDSSYDFTQKCGLIRLEAGEVCVKKHSIQF